MIHTVGPIWRGGNQGEPELLAACYRNSLTLAKAQNCDSVAFPMISTGIYGYPKAAALQIAVHEVTTFLKENDMTVFLIVFSAESMGIAGKLFGNIKAYIDDVYAETHDDRESRRSIVDNRSAASAPKKNRFGILPRPQERKPSLAEDRSTPPPTMDKLSADSDFLFTLPEKPLLSLDEMLAQMDEGFPAMLLRKIDERQMTDSECYKRANIDRRLFNKIKNNPGYRPGKQTVLTFAVALRLSLEETKEMLSKAGYSLTHSSKSDIVVEYCILNKIYDIVEINQVLFGFDLQLLGY